MSEKIKNIFNENIKLLGELDRAIVYFREQQYEKGLSIVVNSIEQMKYSLDAIINHRDYFNIASTDTIFDMLSGIIEAQRNKDNILLSDLLELQLIRFLYEMQEQIMSKEEALFDKSVYHSNKRLLLKKAVGFEELAFHPLEPNELLDLGYRVEFTNCGLMTLAAQNEGFKFYFHTNNRIHLEAFLLAKHWYKEDKNKYIIYGYGMGYHIKELMLLAKSAEIEIYEADRNIIQLASTFTDMKDILNDDLVKLYYDPEFVLLSERIMDLNSDEEFLVHYPSYKNIKDEIGRKLIETHIPWSKTIEYC